MFKFGAHSRYYSSTQNQYFFLYSKNEITICSPFVSGPIVYFHTIFWSSVSWKGTASSWRKILRNGFIWTPWPNTRNESVLFAPFWISGLRLYVQRGILANPEIKLYTSAWCTEWGRSLDRRGIHDMKLCLLGISGKKLWAVSVCIFKEDTKLP